MAISQQNTKSNSSSKVSTIYLPYPHPKQAQILYDPHRFLVVVTGRRFGKTTVALEKCILAARKEKAQIWYIAPTYRQAKQIAWKMLCEFLRGWSTCKKNESELSITLPNNATISLKGADNPDSLRGVGLNFVVLDEYSDIKREVWEEIIRPTLADTSGGAWFIGTPKGHNHFYELWNDVRGNKKGLDWTTYQLRTEDNPYIPREEIEQAQKGDERIYRQEWCAEFTAFAGKFFTDFDERIHVVEPFPIQSWYRKIVSIDYGFTAPSAVGWWAIDNDANIICYKELYEKGLTYDRLAQKILENTNENLELAIADPSIWAKEGTIGESGAERMEKYFHTRGIPLLKADNDRKIGWGQTREIMKVFSGAFGKKTSRLKIFRTCHNLIRTIPSMVYKENNCEDLDTLQEDHAVDQMRYATMYFTRMQKAQIPMSPLDKRIYDLTHKTDNINPNLMYSI